MVHDVVKGELPYYPGGNYYTSEHFYWAIVDDSSKDGRRTECIS